VEPTSDAEDWDDARRWAEQVLGEPIHALEPLSPKGRRTAVARCRHGGATSILKRGNDSREHDALAALAGTGVAPRLRAGDRERHLVLMEDVAGESLEAKLLRAGDPDAARGLVDLARSLGRLHAATPRSEPPIVVDTERVGAAWGLETHGPLVLEASALVQQDVGPDNCIVSADGARLIDFEIAGPGHPLTDLVACHMGFPNCGAAAGAIPAGLLARMDAAYGPIDPAAWRTAYAMRLLDRLDRHHAWGVRERDYTWGRASGRQRVLALLQGCPEGVPLAAEFAALFARLRDAWPDAPTTMPVFPALDGADAA